MLKLQNRVLVCPLDWGLGHASRMIPVVHALLKHEYEVVIAADNYPLQLLKKEFPQLESVKFPSVTVKYSKGGSLVSGMFKQLPALLFQVYKEHILLKKIIRDHDINIVVSDNRFGLWNHSVLTVFITHQLKIIMPEKWSFFETPVCLLNRFFIDKFDQCWVPDLAGKINVSGDLSHKLPVPSHAYFVGILSRFTNLKKEARLDQTTDVLVILSGPEPQRGILEELLKKQLKGTTYSVIIVGGTPGDETRNFIADKIIKVPHLDTEAMLRAIQSSKYVICRSGYSSIMDLIALKKKAIMVPTPGQTEQEYLADFMNKKGWFYCQKQDGFNLGKAIENIDQINPDYPEFNEGLLNKAISALRQEDISPE